jgi:type II secretory ATPase GspE/PulE/Tfp pilus assembly ATPase PilB-like protein
MFNPAKGLFDLERLGYAEEFVRKLESLLFDLRGMVVLTGPSGSGKTTTLYACLRKIHQKNDQFASIVTIEDPVEYDFGSWAQIQVNRQVGLDFAKILAAVLRQDPEVIMIGEIRDQETCDIALRAGLTGHLVLTTIHSGSASEVVTRILNMGIEPFVCASALSGVVAQRLVRMVCASCAYDCTPEKSYVDYVERALGRTDLRFRKGRGCQKCGYTGFRGRTPIAELLVFDDQLRSLVLEQPSTATLRKFAIGRGMHSLLEDGLEKVARGETTLDEVFRVASLREGGA